MNTIESIKKLAKERNTLVCAGIDPVLEYFPQEILKLSTSNDEKLLIFLKQYIDIVTPYVCVFKIQKAYFDIFENGHALLKEVIAYAHQYNTPVIVDCKIGDIDATMNAYLKNIFDLLEADGVVVNPYMGDDVMLPFGAYPDKAIVPLVKTSNPSGSVVQNLILENGNQLWLEILDMVMNRWNTSRNMIPVIASTQDLNLLDVRKRIGDDTLVLFAGMGAQGGKLTQLKQLLNTQGQGVFVNSSRALMYPKLLENEKWGMAIHRVVRDFRDQLNCA